jgi:hypothetical protein
MIPALAGSVPEVTQKSKRRSGTESMSSPATFGGVLAIGYSVRRFLEPMLRIVFANDPTLPKK